MQGPASTPVSCQPEYFPCSPDWEIKATVWSQQTCAPAVPCEIFWRFPYLKVKLNDIKVSECDRKFLVLLSSPVVLSNLGNFLKWDISVRQSWHLPLILRVDMAVEAPRTHWRQGLALWKIECVCPRQVWAQLQELSCWAKWYLTGHQFRGPECKSTYGTFFPGGTAIKICLPMRETQETRVWSLAREDPLEKKIATCSSALSWKIPWTEESGGLQSMELQRVRHESAHTLMRLPAVSVQRTSFW